jgi:hypothetical protein
MANMMDLQRSICLVLGPLALVACHGDPLDKGDSVGTAKSTSTLASVDAGGASSVSPPNGVVLFASWQETMSGTGIMMFVASIHNGTNSSIFVDSTCTADWWRLDGDTWVLGASTANVCPSAVVHLVELPAGQTFYANNAFNLPAFGAGTYRLRGKYWVNCVAGQACGASMDLSSQTVWVASNASQLSAPPVGPGGLHATCTKEGPCPAGQTAIAYTGTGDTCTCEIPCGASATDCPSGTACAFVSAPLGSMCK